jgi:hypothetical protein
MIGAHPLISEIIDGMRYLPNYLQFRALPVALFAAAFSIAFQEHRRLNLSLQAVGGVGVFVYAIAIFLAGGISYLSGLAAAIVAAVTCLVVGIVVDRACFAPWRHLPAAVPAFLSFGVLLLIQSSIAEPRKLMFGRALYFLPGPSTDIGQFEWALLIYSPVLTMVGVAAGLWAIRLRRSAFRSPAAGALLSGHSVGSILAGAAVLFMASVGNVEVQRADQLVIEPFLALCAAIAAGLDRPGLSAAAGMLVTAVYYVSLPLGIGWSLSAAILGLALVLFAVARSRLSLKSPVSLAQMQEHPTAAGGSRNVSPE